MAWSLAEFTTRYSDEVVAQWLTFDAADPVEPADVLAHPRLAAADADALGRIKASARVADRYTDAEIDAVFAADDSFAFLVRCCVIQAELWVRKTQGGQDPAKAPLDVARGEQWLLDLEQGRKIFATAAAEAAAGLPEVVRPTSWERQAAGLFADQPYYPARGSDLRR